MSEQTAEEKKELGYQMIFKSLLEGYKRKTKHIQPLLRDAMLKGYVDAVNDTIAVFDQLVDGEVEFKVSAEEKKAE